MDAIIRSTQFGHVDLAKILLDKGANIEAADEYGRTPLLVVTQFGHVDRRYHLSSTREEKKKKKRKLASAHPILEYPPSLEEARISELSSIRP